MIWPRIADWSAGLVIVGVLILVALGLITHVDILRAATVGERAFADINTAHKLTDICFWLLISFFAGVLVSTGGRRSLGVILAATTVAIALCLAVTISAMANEAVGSARTSLQLAHMNVIEYKHIFETIPVDRRPIWLTIFVYTKVAAHVFAVIAVYLTKPPHRALFLKWSALLLMTLGLFLTSFSTFSLFPLIDAFVAHAIVAWAGVASLGFLAIIWLSQTGRVPARRVGLAILFGAGVPLTGFGGSWLGGARYSGLHTTAAGLTAGEMENIFVFGAVAAAAIAIGVVAAVWRRFSPPSLMVNPDHF